MTAVSRLFPAFLASAILVSAFWSAPLTSGCALNMSLDGAGIHVQTPATPRRFAQTSILSLKSAEPMLICAYLREAGPHQYPWFKLVPADPRSRHQVFFTWK
jgi:hypothetical protein